MNSNAILSSDVLDILFDNRNKQYGAYTLRKFYPERVKKSLFIMLGLVTVLCAFTFLPAGTATGTSLYDEGGLIVKQIQELKDIVKPKEIAVPQKKSAPRQQFTRDYVTVKDDKPSTKFNTIENMAIGTSTDTTGIGSGPVDIFPATPGGGSAVPEPPAPEPAITTPVENPDIQASFPGGSKALVDFLQRNLHSPEDISEPVQVKVKFVVGFDGNLQGFEIVQDGGQAFNKEVERVFKKMPAWMPGKKGGRNVPVYYYLPIKFEASE